MDPTMFYLQTQLRRLESDCDHQARLVARARTMREVKQLTHIVVKAELHCLSESKQLVSELRRRGQRRMEEILETQLATLKQCATSQEMREARGKLMMGEWQSLRGGFSLVYHHAEKESGKMLYLLEKREKEAAAASDPDEPDAPATPQP